MPREYTAKPPFFGYSLPIFRLSLKPEGAVGKVFDEIIYGISPLLPNFEPLLDILLVTPTSLYIVAIYSRLEKRDE